MHRPRLLVIVGLAVVASFAMGVYGATLFTRAGDDTSAQVSAQFESAISSSADANLLVAGLSGSAVQAGEHQGPREVDAGGEKPRRDSGVDSGIPQFPGYVQREESP